MFHNSSCQLLTDLEAILTKVIAALCHCNSFSAELLLTRLRTAHAGSAANTSYDENWEHVARKGKSNVTRGQEDVQGGRTLTSQIFGGAVQSTVKAARAKASVTVQPFNLLHLDIQSVNNVPAALQMLTKPEDIHGMPILSSPSSPFFFCMSVASMI